MFKWSLTRDFRLQFFLHEYVSPWALSNLLGPFGIFTHIRGEMHKIVSIEGVNNTDDKLLPVSLT